MTEIEKIKYTKSFIDSLAEGIDPESGFNIPEGEVAKHPRIKGCFLYVSSLLDRLAEYEAAEEFVSDPCEDITDTKEYSEPVEQSDDDPVPELLPFYIDADRIEKIPVFESKVSLGALIARINGFADLDICKRLVHSDVTEWLISLGFMCRSYTAEGRFRRIPTPAGEKIGLDYSRCTKENGDAYDTVLYSPIAQRFILEKLPLVMTFIASGGKARAEVAAHEERQTVLEALREIGEVHSTSDSDTQATDIKAQDKGSEPSCKTTEPKRNVAPEEVHLSGKGKNVSADFKPGGEEPGLKYKCFECKHCRMGDCFGTEICEDFEPAFTVSKSESDAWPKYGDATIIAERIRRERAAKDRCGGY